MRNGSDEILLLIDKEIKIHEIKLIQKEILLTGVIVKNKSLMNLKEILKYFPNFQIFIGYEDSRNNLHYGYYLENSKCSQQHSFE